MQNLEFILGVLTTFGVFGIGYAVVGVFKITKRLKGFEKSFNKINEDLKHQSVSIYKRFDDEKNEVERNFDHVYRTMDSRLDKLEIRLKQNGGAVDTKQLLND